MNTLEIRAGEGGVDAEAFATELAEAVEKALTKESFAYTRTANTFAFSLTYPDWL